MARDDLSQKQMPEMLNIAQQTILYSLRAIGKIQNSGKWALHELNDREMENGKIICEILLQRHKRIVAGNE